MPAFSEDFLETIVNVGWGSARVYCVVQLSGWVNKVGSGEPTLAASLSIPGFSSPNIFSGIGPRKVLIPPAPAISQIVTNAMHRSYGVWSYPPYHTVITPGAFVPEAWFIYSMSYFGPPDYNFAANGFPPPPGTWPTEGDAIAAVNGWFATHGAVTLNELVLTHQPEYSGFDTIGTRAALTFINLSKYPGKGPFPLEIVVAGMDSLPSRIFWELHVSTYEDTEFQATPQNNPLWAQGPISTYVVSHDGGGDFPDLGPLTETIEIDRKTFEVTGTET